MTRTGHRRHCGSVLSAAIRQRGCVMANRESNSRRRHFNSEGDEVHRREGPSVPSIVLGFCFHPRRCVVSKSLRLAAHNVLALAISLLLLSLVPGTALAQSHQGRTAVFGIGPENSPLLNQTPPPAGTQVWVDTKVKTLIEGWTEYDPITCTDISTGNFTILTAPTHGQLFFDVENF